MSQSQLLAVGTLMKPSLTPADLKAIYVRALGEEQVQLVNLADATPRQFAAWYASRLAELPPHQQQAFTLWTQAERATVCDAFWQLGRLTLITSLASPEIQRYIGNLKTVG